MPEPERKPPPGVRQLDITIVAVACFIAAAIPIAALFQKYGNAEWSGLQWQDWFTRDLTMGMSDVFGNIIILALIGWGIWALIKKFSTKAAIKAAGPGHQVIPAYESGPMKVEIAFQEIPAKNVTHRLYGGDHWWRMHMNIRMSNEDWALFQKSGMIDKELFSYPDLAHSDGHSAIDTSFTGYQLKYMPNYRDFPDIQTAEAAKETLIKYLHIARGRIDDMKSNKGGIEPERIEI